MVARDEDSIGPTSNTIIAQFSQNVKSSVNSDKSVTQKPLHYLQLRARNPSCQWLPTAGALIRTWTRTTAQLVRGSEPADAHGSWVGFFEVTRRKILPCRGLFIRE